MPPDPIFVTEHMPLFMQVALGWIQSQPILSALLVMMALDWVTGVAVAFATKKLSSSVSWRGCSKKVITLILVGFSVVLEPFSGGLPLSKMVALFYLYNEALSVLENAAAIGVPLPRGLVDALEKLREGNSKDIGGGVARAVTKTTTTITTPGAIPVTVEVNPPNPTL